MFGVFDNSKDDKKKLLQMDSLYKDGLYSKAIKYLRNELPMMNKQNIISYPLISTSSIKDCVGSLSYYQLGNTYYEIGNKENNTDTLQAINCYNYALYYVQSKELTALILNWRGNIFGVLGISRVAIEDISLAHKLCPDAAPIKDTIRDTGIKLIEDIDQVNYVMPFNNVANIGMSLAFSISDIKNKNNIGDFFAILRTRGVNTDDYRYE